MAAADVSQHIATMHPNEYQGFHSMPSSNLLGYQLICKEPALPFVLGASNVNVKLADLQRVFESKRQLCLAT